MTSSWSLTQRKKNNHIWSIDNFGDRNNTLGGWEDHYIVNGAHRDCHPDFEAIPIGDPYGFMVCKRRTDEINKRKKIRESEATKGTKSIKGIENAYHVRSSDLYDPRNEKPRQISNPDDYYSRDIKNGDYLRQNDYISRSIDYNGVGVISHHKLRVKNNVYGGNGNSHFRGQSNSIMYPPYKYDVTHLNQKYPLWKKEQINGGYLTQEEADDFDQNYNESLTSSVW